MDYAIETDHLTKKYKDVKAVDDLGIRVPVGKVYGFLGRNGSGKTTTIRMIMDLIKPDTGHVKIFGHEMTRNRSQYLADIGAIIETPGFYENLSAYENLEITSKMFKTEEYRINESLETVGLSDTDTAIGNKPVGKFSLGMKQRLGIANALIHSPRILILDEPTNGLDPAGIIDMRKLIRHLSESMGITIFVSSHLLSEVQQIADYIGIIDQGRLLEEGEIELINSDEQSSLILETDQFKKTAQILEATNFDFQKLPEGFKVFCKREDNVIINKTLVENKINVYNLESVSKTLEERFLGITDTTDFEVIL
ncbi:ABC transporter ATP-binding protein [Methanobacterium petrolearium]|uniref:ABC transporter ATP-binding protein n=1 Tax=Methanobacterium petrolearium TaxID=710190 RepID=UPI001AEA476F|nr:ABC transporter ATP-binding protein [Methanobacterium petrolearium]MBP1946524.1 ABC-type multidrug transport system ATPase subunit [Methanobacterium petrolearium]BDZ69868.1 bacitracin ABC transporter ATP-binding protein [Methanobacterium petrolearium]